jgi:hypothetical protein
MMPCGLSRLKYPSRASGAPFGVLTSLSMAANSGFVN